MKFLKHLPRLCSFTGMPLLCFLAYTAGCSNQSTPSVSGVSCATSSVKGAGQVACSVTLSSAVSAVAQSVSLASSSAAVVVPVTVGVPQGSNTASFTAAFLPVSTAQTVTLTATGGGASKSFTLQLASTVPTLSVSPDSLSFGNVAIGGNSTLPLTLTSSGDLPVIISAATASGAGLSVSGATLPVTLDPGQSMVLNVSFTPGGAGLVNGSLVITSNSSTGSATTVGLSGTGMPVVSVTVAPASMQVGTGKTLQLVATVTGTANTAVNWTVAGAGCTGIDCGTISSGGMYTAPDTVPNPALVTATATSQDTPTSSGSATLTILQSASTTYYLAPAADGGNDTNDGLTASTPWGSPNHALNCGDVILASAGIYSAANFYTGNWGTVTCASGDNVAWLKCATFDTCKISATNYPGMWVDKSYWGIQGWEITTSPSDLYGTCFIAQPNWNNPVNIHHIIFANNVANGCSQSGFASTPNIPTLTGVDYLEILGNIAYNAASGSGTCTSGISVWQPVQSDSNPGTHIYVAGNFSYGNLDPSQCNGGSPTDGEGIIFDTFDGSQTSGLHPYTAQAVAYNNIVASNGGKGIEVFNNQAGNYHASIWIKQNTIWGDLTDPNQSWYGCGELAVSAASDVSTYGNLISTNGATGCTGKSIYAMSISGGDATDNLSNNWAYGYEGNNTFIWDSGSFAFGSNILATSPAFVNAVAPGAPACAGTANVPACMSLDSNNVIGNFVPTANGSDIYGRETPSNTPVTDPLYPSWLCHVTNLPSGLVTPGCS